MKSKRAEEYIDENVYDAAELVDKDGCGWAVVRRHDAYRAVEIVEEEMIEKAAELHSQTCNMYAGYGLCLHGGRCKDCELIADFKQKMME